MPTLVSLAEFDHLLDGLALAAGLMILCLLTINRLKYGKMYLDGGMSANQGPFAEEMSRQMISQQSRKIYANLQRALAREFESLCTLEGGGRPEEPVEGGEGRVPSRSVPGGSANRRDSYRLARELLSSGTDGATIRRQCHLAENEYQLLLGLHKLAEEGPSE